MKFLVCGHIGQLGSEFCKYFDSNGLSYQGLDINEINISDTNSVISQIKLIGPDIVINCAAYNLVDKAEDTPGDAYAVNTIGAANLALACDLQRAKLVHFSTDYVFDGAKGLPYLEEDNANPINTYGKSKLLGEKMISSILGDYLIFRLSWLYGNGKQNFITKLLELSDNQDTLKIAEDETSVPTYTGTVVWLTMKALEENLKGLYHLTSGGKASRLDWAREIFDSLSIKKEIEAVSMDYFNLAAHRPKNSAMSNVLLSSLLGVTIPDWQMDLRYFLKTNF
jgi:dTDP-4-dehydrorhamnose reductase